MNPQIEILRFLCWVGYRMSSRTNGFKGSTTTAIYAELVYSRIVDNAVSILKLVGVQPREVPDDIDAPSLASLTRNLIEAYDTLWYIALEPVPEEHRAFRFKLWGFHQQMELSRIKRHLPVGAHLDAYLRRFDMPFEGIALAILEEDPVFAALEPKVKAGLTKGKTPFYGRTDDPRKLSLRSSDEWKALYKLLSNHVHANPLGIHIGFRTRSRALLDEEELTQIVLSATIQHLALATVGYLRKLRRYNRLLLAPQRRFLYRQIQLPGSLPRGVGVDTLRRWIHSA